MCHNIIQHDARTQHIVGLLECLVPDPWTRSRSHEGCEQFLACLASVMRYSIVVRPSWVLKPDGAHPFSSAAHNRDETREGRARVRPDPSWPDDRGQVMGD